MAHRPTADEMLAAAANDIEAADFDPVEKAIADEADEQARIAEADRIRAEATAAIMPTLPTLPDGTVHVTGEQLVQMMQQMMQTMLAMQKQGPSAAEIAEITAKAMEAGADRIKPHEITLARIDRKSVYNPEGDKANPRPKLKCAMFLGAAPLGTTKEVTVLTRPEIDALNLIEPGHYRIEKMDRSRVVIEVRGRRDSNQNLDRLWILFPDSDEQKNLYPPLDALAGQCCEANRISNPAY